MVRRRSMLVQNVRILAVVALLLLTTMLRLSNGFSLLGRLGVVSFLRPTRRNHNNISRSIAAQCRALAQRPGPRRGGHHITATANSNNDDEDPREQHHHHHEDSEAEVEEEVEEDTDRKPYKGRVEIIETIEWVQRVVIGLNLCPFARQPLREKRLHVRLVDDPDQIVSAVQTEMEQLISADSGTTLVVCPSLFPNDFVSFWDVVQSIETNVIDANEWQGIVQVAPFHPHFCFAGSAPHHPDNYTNRSPYPMIHILREADVTKAVDSLPDGDAGLIWSRNVRLLNDLSAQLPADDFATLCRGQRTAPSVRETLRRILRTFDQDA
jgi:uncharacterized protein